MMLIYSENPLAQLFTLQLTITDISYIVLTAHCVSMHWLQTALHCISVYL